MESRLHFRVHSGIEVLKTDKKKKKSTVATTTNGNNKNRVPSAKNDAIDGNSAEDDDEEFSDVSGEVEQYQSNGHYGIDTESVASSTSHGNLSAAARKNDVISPTLTAKSKLPSPKNSISQQVVKSTSSAGSSKSASPFHTPPTTPPFLSEASSSVSPKHTYNNVGGATTDDSPRLSRETAI